LCLLPAKAETEGYMNYKCVTTIKELQEYISNNKLVAFDIETSATNKFRNDNKAPLDPHKANITGISFSVEQGTAIYVPLSHRVGQNADHSKMVLWLKDNFFNNGEIIKIAHNLAFETMFLYALEITIAPPVYDTMLASMMTLKSNTEFRILTDSGLKTLVPALLQMELPKFEEVVGNRFFDELEPQDYETIRYACADSDYTLQLYYLFNNWFDRFLPKHRWIIENIESPTAIYVGIMKYNGVSVDKALMYQSQFEAGEKILLLRSQIKGIIGDIDIGENAVTADLKKYLHETLNLPVLKTTAKYQAAADEEAFILLKEWCINSNPNLYKLFDLILEFRKWGKIKSTYIDGYLKCVNNETERLHPNFFQLGAESGRFSCRNPNIQNQLSNGEIKVRDFIIAPENHSLIELDYSQIEARLAAFLSRDEKLLNVFQDKKDLHAMTTSAVFGIPLTEAMDKNNHDYKHRRTVAKTTFFGFLYGIYAKSLMRNLKLSANIESTMDECKLFLLNLSESYVTLSQWQKDTISKAKFCGYAETMLGRRRYLPLIHSGDFIKRGNAERSALNHGVQGLAADILKLSMARLITQIPAYLKPIFTVHDSLVFECPDSKISDGVAIIKQAMEILPPIDGFDIDIVAEVSIGKSYGNMTELN